MEREQIRVAGAAWKDAREGQEQARVRRRVAARVEVDELRRPAGDVVDDHVGHDLGPRGQRPHVVPGAEPRIDLGVVDRVEAGVGAVDRMEERQDVHAAERLAQRAVEQALKIAERAAGAAVDVGDELRLVLHRAGMAPRTAATAAPARFAKSAIVAAGQSDARPWTNAAANASPAPTVSTTVT